MTFWPDLPETIPVGFPGWAAAPPTDPPAAPSAEQSGSAISSVARVLSTSELRLVTPQDAAAVEASVPEADRAETFAFFTMLPFPVAEFIADPEHRMYALWSEGQVLASTTVYNGDPHAGTAMLGYTWVAPQYRGRASSRSGPGEEQGSGHSAGHRMGLGRMVSSDDGEQGALGRPGQGQVQGQGQGRRHGQGGEVNAALKQAMYTAFRDAGLREVWFRADVENLRSCRSMEKNGAQRMHIAEEPRVYPELPWRTGRVSQSVYYRKTL